MILINVMDVELVVIGIFWLSFFIIIIYSHFFVDFELEEILRKEGIPMGFIPFYFSYRKFKKFLEEYHEDDDKKRIYTLWYKKAVRMRRILYIMFLSWFLLLLFLGIVDVYI